FIHFPSEPVGFTCPFHQFGVLARVAVTQVVEWHGPRVRLLLAGWSGRGGAGGARGGRTGPARLLIAWLGIGAWRGQGQTVARGRSGERRQRTRLAGEVGSRRVVDLKRCGRQDEIVAVAVMEAQLIVSGLAGSFQCEPACVARDSKGSEKAF